MKVKISKKVEWMRPFIEEAARTHPKIARKLKKVYVIPATVDRKHQAYAQLSYDEDNYCYIGIYLKYQTMVFKKDDTITIGLRPFSKMDLIESLAHELAHVYHFFHTPKHKKLECRFKMRFCTMLEKEGYISEEEELKTKI